MWVWLVKFYVQIVEVLDNRDLDNRGWTVQHVCGDANWIIEAT